MEQDSLESPAPSTTAAAEGFASTESLQSLTPVQQRIWAALTRRPLSNRQATVLEIYFQAHLAHEAPLSIDEVGSRLAKALGLPRKRASAFVIGSLSSFGRRLANNKKGSAKNSDHEAGSHADSGESPSRALLSSERGSRCKIRHRLTYDGLIAVAIALGINGRGIAATSASRGDPVLDDPNAVVMVGMTRASASLLLRIQKSVGQSMDATVRALAERARAGGYAPLSLRPKKSSTMRPAANGCRLSPASASACSMPRATRSTQFVDDNEIVDPPGRSSQEKCIVLERCALWATI